MGKWWVPGLQIGYEHTFVHQVADFIAASNPESPAIQLSAMLWKPRRSAKPFWTARNADSGRKLRSLTQI
jgi:hypothetical protein